MLPMGLSEKHLTEGEHVVMELKEHAKALFWPLVLSWCSSPPWWSRCS